MVFNLFAIAADAILYTTDSSVIGRQFLINSQVFAFWQTSDKTMSFFFFFIFFLVCYNANVTKRHTYLLH